MSDLENISSEELISIYRQNEIQVIQLNNLQHALKILVNGLYGALGNKYFRWFDINFAESITLTGQLYIKWVAARVNEYLNMVLKSQNFNYIVAGDTDSIYVNLDPLVSKMGLTDISEIISFLDKVCKVKLEPVIRTACDNLADQLNAYNRAISMKREIIADKAIWRAAKNYVMNVYDKEGVRYEKPKQVYKGLEVVRSSTPMVCRDKLKKCLEIIMTRTEKELQDYIVEFHDEYMKMSFRDVARPGTADLLEKYSNSSGGFKDRCPIHIRASLIYNEIIKGLGLEKKHALIKNKDKIKYAYLKMPNPTKNNVIALPDAAEFLPKQFELEEYVDYDTQWDKTFLSPIKSITDTIGWSVERRTKISAFFR